MFDAPKKTTFYHTLFKSTVGYGWKETTILWDFNEIRDNQEMMGNSVYVINSFGLLSNPSWFYFCQSISLNETLKICSTDSTRDVGTSSCKLFNVFVNWNSSGISYLFFSTDFELCPILYLIPLNLLLIGWKEKNSNHLVKQFCF